MHTRADSAGMTSAAHNLEVTATLDRLSAADHPYAGLELFQNVDFDSVGHLLEACHEIRRQSGEVILEQGEQNNCLFQVLSGRLEVQLDNKPVSPVILLNQGACVGELSILSSIDVSAKVIAATSCTLLVIPGDIVWAFTNSSHEFASNLLDILAGRVRADNHRLIAANAKEHHKRVSRVDSVTGLFNRAWFDDTLVRHCQRAQRENVALSVIFIDIDHFKSINDRFGHLIGDAILAKVAESLQQGIRSIDTAARFGGEEFALLLFGINSTEAREIADRLRREISQLVLHVESDKISVTVSAGVAQLTAEESPASFLNGADSAMYRAKKNGRNQVAIRL
ncbi:MAG: diguanylate cyclase [Gammaproteobacteria bacterium]